MDWTRGHTIGRGSSATVSVATSPHSDHLFAVKSAEFSNSGFLQREQQILSSLSHPRVVGYIGCDITGENSKLLYNLFMEYVSGGTLSDKIRNYGGRLEEEMIGYYVWQIVQGLEYLHSNGFVHCDIKGRNILIGESGAKIADFGCAKRINPAEAVAISGTPAFMAPEVARGEEQGLGSDIWALGCTIIEMATGCLPWLNVSNPVTILYKIAYSGEMPEIPRFLSDQAKDFLEKCLIRDPRERWTASQLLKHPFLAEFKSSTKQIQESNTFSPTSILDQRIWNSMEESETWVSVVQPSSENSPSDRIRQFSLSSEIPNWDWDEDWIMIRENINTINSDIEICGGVVSEELVNFLNDSVSCRIGGDFFRFREDSAVMNSNLCFDRHRDKLLLPSISKILES